MDEEEERGGDDGPSIPAWVMTFADLMSLLMCFFVLLLSFSEMDVSKYKQIAGSMAHAFGVQREVKVKDPPKGVNVIAQEFSAGRPAPTVMNVVRQMTTDDLRQFLEMTSKRRTPRPSPQTSEEQQKELKLQHTEKGAPGEGLKSGAASMQGEKQLASANADGGREGVSEDGEQGQQSASMQTQGVDAAKLKAMVAAELLRRQQEKLEEDADKIRMAMREGLNVGSVEVETEELKIIIRIRENASFGPGGAEITPDFKPVLKEVGEIVYDIPGTVVVSGHTDDVPIKTARFRSNWELSAARAVSVVHEMMYEAGIPERRFEIKGHADTRPMVPNTNQANRIKNRRVEIVVSQAKDLELEGQITADYDDAPGSALDVFNEAFEEAERKLNADAETGQDEQTGEPSSPEQNQPEAPPQQPAVPPPASDPFIRATG